MCVPLVFQGRRARGKVGPGNVVGRKKIVPKIPGFSNTGFPTLTYPESRFPY